MVRPDLSNEDWLELYRFLLERLESRGFVDAGREIEVAAAAPVFERGSEDEEARIWKEFKGEVGQRALRRRDPFEVFTAALDVIWTRLVELPEVASAIQRNLDGAKRQIEFRVDYEEQYAPTQSEPIPLERLQLSEAEKSSVREVFNAIGVRPERLGDE